jgi:phage repressor protein C with HTH and peptisase S24 domain
MLDLMAADATVSFRPTGNSMTPLIRSRALVTVAPTDPARIEPGDHRLMAAVRGRQE